MIEIFCIILGFILGYLAFSKFPNVGNTILEATREIVKYAKVTWNWIQTKFKS